MLHQASFTILCFYKRNFFSYLSACLSPPSPQIATHKESISIFRTTTYTFTALPKAAVDRRGILVQLLLFPNTYFPFLSPPFSLAPILPPWDPYFLIPPLLFPFSLFLGREGKPPCLQSSLRVTRGAVSVATQAGGGAARSGA